MRFTSYVKRTLAWMAGMMMGLTLAVALSFAQSVPALPDIVGIRPGMTPQEAYEALKAHGKGAKVGVGQIIYQGISEKPVVVVMSVQVMGASPAEVIAVWLTPPPNRQQVFAIRRTLQFDPGHEMLKSEITQGLTQKYGPQTSGAGRNSQGMMDRNMLFWMFDEQGGRLDLPLPGGGCLRSSLMNVPAPQDPTAPQPITPLFSILAPHDSCRDVISVWTESMGGASQGSNYTASVTVLLEDLPLARRAHDAFRAYLANADEAKRKEDLEKAKQQKTPSF